MGKLVISENVSLDGVVRDPAGDEGVEHGGWFNQHFERVGETLREEWAAVEFDEALAAAALLFGRRSYDWFASRWSTRPGPWADRLRDLPKYVVSSTEVDSAWRNVTVLAGDPVTTVGKLKHELAGTIVVYASQQLAGSLLQHGLVDELRLMVFPVVLGSDDRLFDHAATRIQLRLTSARTIAGGITNLTYECD